MYSRKIEDEKLYEKMILGIDFKGRTVIKIITMNSYAALMDGEDPKAENIMVKIWHGKESTKCDGNFLGYSNIGHLLLSRTKRVSGKVSSFFSMVTNFFEPNFKVDYSF